MRVTIVPKNSIHTKLGNLKLGDSFEHHGNAYTKVSSDITSYYHQTQHYLCNNDMCIVLRLLDSKLSGLPIEQVVARLYQKNTLELSYIED